MRSLPLLLLLGCTAGPVTARNASGLIAARGNPTAFEIECSRVAYDKASGRWNPLAGFVRVDSWLYAVGTQADLYVLVNGEVVKAQRVDKNLSGYVGTGLNPRIVGCGETEAVVTTVAGGPPRKTTLGSVAPSLLQFGTVAVKVNYHLSSQAALMVTYANGKLVGMVTL